jgi:hypothetical protein
MIGKESDMAGSLKGRTEELRHLYLSQGWSTGQIARHFGITHQAVNYALKKAGVPMRKRGERPLPNPDAAAVKELYVGKNMSMAGVARELGVDPKKVRAVLEAEGLGIRRGSPQERYPQFRVMKIGDSIEVNRPKWKGVWQSQFYVWAARSGIKVSVRTLSDTTVRLTRIG